MGKKKRNSFKEALNHIKSDKFNMIESIPTNNTANLMVVTPTTPNPDFVPEVISDLKPDFTVGANPTTLEEARDMSGFFFPDGSHKFGLPPITESSPDNSYILGPMSSMWYAWGNFSSIGYIRQSNRKMVDLGYITGKLSDWDGTSAGTNFYSQLTLEQAVWFRDNIKAPGQTNDPDTANFRAFYPGPPSNTPDEFNRYYATVSGVPKEEDTPAQGSPFIQGVNGPESAEDFFALLMKKLRKAGDSVEIGIEGAIEWAKDKSEDVLDWASDFFGKNSELWEYKDAIGDRLNALDNWVDENIRDPGGTKRQLFTDFAEITSEVVGEVQQWVTGKDITTSVNLMNDFNQHALDMEKNPNTSGSSWNNPKDVSDRIDKGDMDALNEVTKSEKWQNEIDKYNNGEISKKDLERNLTSQFEDVIYSRPGLDQSIHNGSQIINIDDVITGENPKIGKQYDFNEGDSVAEGEKNAALYAYSQIMNLPLDAFGTGKDAGLIALYAKFLGLSNADRYNGILNMPPMVMSITVGGGGNRRSESFRLSNYITEQKITYKPIGGKAKIKAKYKEFKKKNYGKDRLSLYDFLPSFASISKKVSGGRPLSYTTRRGGVQESISYERKKKILKDIKKPVIIEEKKYKQGKYRPKIIGSNSITKISKPVETPREFKEIGTRNSWGKFEKKRNRIESQEKMNSVYEILGGGNLAYNYMLTDSKRMNAEQMEKFWGLHPEMFSYYLNGKKYKVTRKEQVKGDYVVFLVDEKGEKSSILQSQLNEKVSEEKSKELFEKYYEQNPKSKPIPYDKDPLFKKVSNRLKPVIDYPNKPSKDGYPDKEPPKMINGFHPEIGKKYKYDKLDPHSAEMMPMQGDPEIDANIIKSRNKKEKERKEKILKLEDLTYHYFVKRAKESSKKVNQEKQKNREMAKTSLYKDKKEKGIKFYDKKGSGRIKAGKKVYD